ncbi:MerR family transcriptional regulator [Cohnella mopanensis]|uniref:MerR family transcriptional regulator n=1 Tax=Cohnella mopanensis TaxID=2911966 RepID=UPI001EF928C6|nr:MerR family transcriptional regulator [Cohnella mopanensis]
MTISQFSERTGLRPKILRYYEETGLIVPELRSANGYRQYSDSQIETAQLVNSLRQADVAMSSISRTVTENGFQGRDDLHLDGPGLKPKISLRGVLENDSST